MTEFLDPTTATLPPIEIATEPQAPIPAAKEPTERTEEYPAISMRKARGRVFWGPTMVIAGIHLGALSAFFPVFFSVKAVLTALVLHICCTLGVTIGYHRLLTHRSFRVNKFVEYVLTLFGALSLQGGPVKWVATHRLHHQHSDDNQDPHSPLHGFFWSHALWLFTYDPKFDDYSSYSRYALDLANDKGQVFIEKMTPLLQLLVGVLLYLWGGWPCVIWAGCVRLVLVYHITWFVNSASHTWGYRNYETTDQSRNLWWVALLSFGEGWHNNHHAWPRSARHGLRPWEVDVSWMIIRAMSAVGLARDVCLPNAGAHRQMQ